MAHIIKSNDCLKEERRVPLAEKVPLDVPMSIHFSVTNNCNFRCFYCQHGNDDYHKNMHGSMNIADFQKALCNIMKLGKPKKLIFAGLGEPLLNKQLPDMIRFAVDKGIYTDLLTNASILTNTLSDQLIDAGLNELRISLQGLSAEQYFEVCRSKIDFQNLVSNISYFYKRKGNCKLSVKIVDTMLKNESDKERFMDIFGNITDKANIESLIPTNNLVNSSKDNFHKTLKGEEMTNRSVCPLPFYQMIINYNGDIHSGCSNHNGTFNCPIIGNILHDNLPDIWNQGVHKSICLTMLNGEKNNIANCNCCNDYRYQGSSEDNLDQQKDEILRRFRRKENEIS